jgi:hypothetical protein
VSPITTTPTIPQKPNAKAPSPLFHKQNHLTSKAVGDINHPIFQRAQQDTTDPPLRLGRFSCVMINNRQQDDGVDDSRVDGLLAHSRHNPAYGNDLTLKRLSQFCGAFQQIFPAGAEPGA